LVFVAGAVGACSDDGHPDTGYGAGQAVPATRTCMDICARLADCAVNLCNEDTSSSNYSGLEPSLADQCELSCSDAGLAAAFPQPKWDCAFTDSCREVFEHDSCEIDASYTCN
jgi:hypothetical protein